VTGNQVLDLARRAVGEVWHDDADRLAVTLDFFARMTEAPWQRPARRCAVPRVSRPCPRAARVLCPIRSRTYDERAPALGRSAAAAAKSGVNPALSRNGEARKG
jgi:hypothetical protein